MKRALLVILALSFASGLVAAAKGLPPAVRDVVQRALAGEQEAIARYEAFAAKAAEEGYAGAAALFRAQAQAERTHAGRFASLLEERGIAIPAERAPAPRVASTGENLHIAALAETGERDHIYRDAVRICSDHGAADVAKIFDQTRDTEVEHANLCSTAARNLESMKQAKTFSVCGRCGYTTDIDLSTCPVCQHNRMARVH